MIALVLLAAPDSGGQIEQIAKTFGVDWPHLIAQIVSFGIVCFLLQRFAYKPVLALLEQRRRQIELGVANTEKIKEELAKTEAHRQEVMAHAGAEANRLIEEARDAASRVREQETQKAIAAAEQIIVKAREAAEQDYARMLAELKRDVGRLVIQTTAAVTGKILSGEDQRLLNEETARQLEAKRRMEIAA
jgi:F-type H+-transporting ATPase subunit b